ncbi:MAG: hypothetical protein HYZ93_01750 [Candidatus Omnitrophica bacterium]|nr:hypothetical protein [Candidatus Omnitrophota bacterium]
MIGKGSKGVLGGRGLSRKGAKQAARQFDPAYRWLKERSRAMPEGIRQALLSAFGSEMGGRLWAAASDRFGKDIQALGKMEIFPEFLREGNALTDQVKRLTAELAAASLVMEEGHFRLDPVPGISDPNPPVPPAAFARAGPAATAAPPPAPAAAPGRVAAPPPAPADPAPIVEDLLRRIGKHPQEFPPARAQEARAFALGWVPERLAANQPVRYVDFSEAWKGYLKEEEVVHQVLSEGETAIHAAAQSPEGAEQALTRLEGSLAGAVQRLQLVAGAAGLVDQLERLRARVQTLRQVPGLYREIKELAALVTAGDLEAVREMFARGSQLLAQIDLEWDNAWGKSLEEACAQLAEAFAAQMISKVKVTGKSDRAAADQMLRQAVEFITSYTQVLHFTQVLQALQDFEQAHGRSPAQVAANRFLTESRFEPLRLDKGNRHIVAFLKGVLADEDDPFRNVAREQIERFQRSVPGRVKKAVSGEEREFLLGVSRLAEGARGAGRKGGLEERLERVGELLHAA